MELATVTCVRGTYLESIEKENLALKEQIEYFEEEPLSVTLPERVICKVKETEPTVKGQTASNSFKPATLENGFRISVPPFVQQDEEIVVSTETLEYIERA